jgi:hypothetical protein
VFLEYDWTFGCYRPRFGQTFTGIRGVTFFNSLKEARSFLAGCGLALGRKTDSRTWQIIDKELK